MGFAYKSSAAIVLGSFNIHVIQPELLKEAGIAPPDGITADLSRPGFSFASGEIIWHVRPDRLALVTYKSSIDCGSPLAGTLKALKWTPLTGIGTSAEFEADESEVEKLSNRFPECPESIDLEYGSRVWSIALKRARQTFIFQVVLEPRVDDGAKCLKLSINVHTEIPPEFGQVGGNDLARSAAIDHQKHLTEAIEMASKILKVPVMS